MSRNDQSMSSNEAVNKQDMLKATCHYTNKVK